MNIKQPLQTYAEVIIRNALKLRDIRVIGQVAFAVVVLLVSWSGVKSIDTNYSLQKQVATLQQQNAVQELENTNLKLQNNYYNSDQYLELSARQNFGLAAPGETELIVPAAVALSYTVPMPQPQATKSSNYQPFYLRNIESWVNFFLHRPSAS